MKRTKIIAKVDIIGIHGQVVAKKIKMSFLII